MLDAFESHGGTANVKIQQYWAEIARGSKRVAQVGATPAHGKPGGRCPNVGGHRQLDHARTGRTTSLGIRRAPSQAFRLLIIYLIVALPIPGWDIYRRNAARTFLRADVDLEGQFLETSLQLEILRIADASVQVAGAEPASDWLGWFRNGKVNPHVGSLPTNLPRARYSNRDSVWHRKCQQAGEVAPRHNRKPKDKR